MHKGIINRKTQSYASSPNYLSDLFKSYQSSPILKDSPRVEKLVKNTLKRFESEKADLEKIKEVALSFKESRQKKLKSYNLQTRIGNKVKSKVKRPDNVWLSPEPKIFSLDSQKPKYRHPITSAERRANIGLEYFHLKSPRNLSPKDAKEVKIQKCVGEGKKKGIEEYIKKKKKERVEKEKEIKRVTQENESKRVKLLVKIEKKAKNALKRNKKNRTKKKICPKIVPQSFEYAENKVKKRLFHSEDEEVFRIIHKNDSEKDDSHQLQNNDHRLKGTHLSHGYDSSPLNSKLNVKLKTPKKSSEPNSKMPIVELLSVSHPSSHSSSSELSEQKNLIQKQIKDIKFRLNSIKDPKNFPKTTLLKAQNALKTVILKSISEKFFLIKYFNEYIFNKLSRESSEDMEKFWDKIETFRSTEFLQDNDSISSLVPIDDGFKTSKQNSKRPSEENFEFFRKNSSGKSSVNICEVSHESSFNSLFSWDEDKNIVFQRVSYYFQEVGDQSEPDKPEFSKLEKKEIEIFIDDASGSVKESLAYNRDSGERSFLSTPEAEEVEEFNCADFLIKIRVKEELDEASKLLDNLSYEETIDIILNELILEYLEETVKFEFTNTNFQLIGNNKCLVYDICVRTGVTAVLKFVEKLWAELDPIEISQQIADKSLHLNILLSFRQELKEVYQSIVNQKTLKKLEKTINSDKEVNQAVHFHNKAIFDTINEILLKISKEINPVPWKSGELNARGVELDKVFREVNSEVRRYCMVNAGRIANISFVNAEGVIDSELLQRVRENGLTCLLTAEIEQIEREWVDYEAEEHWTVDELSLFLLDELVFEVAETLLFKGC